MLEDEDDCGCDKDDSPSYVKAKRKHGWVITSAFLELFSDLFMALHKLFSTVEEVTIQRYTYVNEQLKFQQEASQAIEMITEGFDATSKPAGTG